MQREEFRRIVIEEDREWHRVRRLHIQASDAAAILGDSPWRTAAELYDIKSGQKPEPDIGSKPYVVYGKRMEPLIRAEFEVDHPYFRVTYRQFDILESRARPWQGCTLDGELEVIADNPWGLPVGARGVLEIKTGSFRGRRDLEEWEDGIPQHYYEQVLHQLSVTGYGFAVVVARLRRDPFRDEDNGFPEVVHRNALFKRDEVAEDIEILNQEEADFWNRLKEGRRPAVRLSF